MKLLFDANLSPNLVHRLAEIFPDSVHVFDTGIEIWIHGQQAGIFPHSVHALDTGLARFTSDEVIWQYAAAQGFTIVTADADFLDLAKSRGVPPKVVRLENCNYRTSQVEDLLRRHAILIAELEQSSRSTLIIRNTS